MYVKDQKRRNEWVVRRLKEENQNRERVEEALCESQRKYDMLVSNVPGVVYRCTFGLGRNMSFLSPTQTQGFQ